MTSQTCTATDLAAAIDRAAEAVLLGILTRAVRLRDLADGTIAPPVARRVMQLLDEASDARTALVALVVARAMASGVRA